MLVRDVMSGEVETIHPDATLQEAAYLMKVKDVGPLPVLEGDRLIGILTDRDLALRAMAEGRDPSRTRVRDIVTPDVVYCFNDETVQQAARLMVENLIRRILVLTRDGRLAGILSISDLALDEEDRELAGEVLREVSQASGFKD